MASKETLGRIRHINLSTQQVRKDFFERGFASVSIFELNPFKINLMPYFAIFIAVIKSATERMIKLIYV